MNWKAMLACLAALVFATAGELSACTLWGAAGPDASGGTIISKNRDWKPDHTQVLKLRRDDKGYAYFGLYAEGGAEPGIKEGVNEKGLTVVTASAGSIPKSVRDDQPGKHGVIRILLSDYATCDEVLAKKDAIFPAARAMFIMISDRKKILMVEVGLNGKYAVRTVQSGSVVHTNHFLDKSLSQFNVTIGSSSAARLGRISDLLEASPRPCASDRFAVMSRDQHDGADNSIWRTGTNGRTLSSWIIETPAEAPKLRVVLANPGQPEETRTFVLDQQFFSGGPDRSR